MPELSRPSPGFPCISFKNFMKVFMENCCSHLLCKHCKQKFFVLCFSCRRSKSGFPYRPYRSHKMVTLFPVREQADSIWCHCSMYSTVQDFSSLFWCCNLELIPQSSFLSRSLPDLLFICFTAFWSAGKVSSLIIPVFLANFLTQLLGNLTPFFRIFIFSMQKLFYFCHGIICLHVIAFTAQGITGIFRFRKSIIRSRLFCTYKTFFLIISVFNLCHCFS